MKKFLLILLVLAVWLPACNAADTTTPVNAPEQGIVVENVVTIRFAINDFERSLYQDLADQFQSEHPEIHVELVSLSDILDLEEDVLEWPEDAWLRIASNADVFRIRSSDREPLQQHAVRDLMPLLEADTGFDAEDFYPNTLQAFQTEDGLWGVPLNLNVDLIFFDKDAFDQAGRSYPQQGWTWNDFLDTAQALTLREGERVTRWGYVQPVPDHLRLIESQVDALFDDVTPRFDQPDVIDAARWYTDLYLQHRVTPYFDQSDPEAAERLIATQQVAMWYDALTSWSWRSQGRHLGVVPIPFDTSAMYTTPLFANGLAISAGSAQPNAAWRWIDFVSRHVLSDLQTLQLLPARRSTAENNDYWNAIDAELAEALRAALERTYIVKTRAGEEALIKAIEKILKGEQSLELALQDAQTEALTQIRAVQITQAEATPVPVIVAGGDDEPVDVDAQEIVFMVSADNALRRYRELAVQFHQLHPDMRVDVQTPWGALSGEVSIRTVAQDADCLQWYWGAGSAQPETLAALASLDALVEADVSFQRDDFFAVLFDLFTAQGQLWGLPAEMTPRVIAYNKDAFDAAGVVYPSADWTMDDWRATALALTKGEGATKQYGYVGSANESSEIMLMIEQLGARWFDDSSDPPRLALNNAATVEALRWYADLYSIYGAKPNFIYDVTTPISFSDLPDRTALIRGGHAAMWSEEAGFAVGGLGDMRVGVAPWPAANDGTRRAVMVAANGYFISARSAARQVCWQWITYLTEQADVVRGLPARRELAESDAYRQFVGAERAEVYLASLARADAASLFANSDQMPLWIGSTEFWLMRAYLQIAEEHMDAQLALDAAQKRVDDYRDCLMRVDGFSDFERQADCMREIDPDLATYLFRKPS